jgi:hypothetical protein
MGLQICAAVVEGDEVESCDGVGQKGLHAHYVPVRMTVHGI